MGVVSLRLRTSSETVDLLFTVLPDTEGVHALLFGPEKLAQRLRPGTVIVDCSAAAPGATRSLAAELAASDSRWWTPALRCRTSGRLTSGRINFLVGADDDRAVARALPLLETMSAHVFKVGPAGSGHTVRALNDYIAAAGLRGALDGLIVGYRYGLDPATMLEVLNLSTGRNFSTEQTLRLYALPRRFETGCSLASLVGSVTNALELARELGLGTELLELVQRDFDAALQNLSDDDVASLLRHWEQQERHGAARKRAVLRGFQRLTRAKTSGLSPRRLSSWRRASRPPPARAPARHR